MKKEISVRSPLNLDLWDSGSGIASKVNVDEKDFGIRNAFVSKDNTTLLVSGYSKNLKKFALSEDGSVKLE